MARTRSNHKYSVEELTYIRDNYAEMSASAIAERLGVPKRCIYMLAHKMGVRKSKEWIARVARENSGLTTEAAIAARFQPGHIPATKGRKMEEFCSPEALARSSATRFKTGHKPRNWRPIGSERKTRDGYTAIKVAEGINQWKLKHKVVWEEHNGKVPRGYKISFRDNNPDNCDISNLYLVTCEDLMRKNTIHNYPEELRDVIRLRGVVTREINKQKKHKDDGKDGN